MNNQNSCTVFEAKNILVEVGAVALLDKISFRLSEGQLGLISGKNGAGKTSLLRILAGLSEPEIGEVLWKGESIYKNNIFRNIEPFTQVCSYFSHSLGFKSVFSVEENLRLMSSLSCTSLKKYDIERILEQISLKEQRNIRGENLSAGQKRRLSFAKVLIDAKPLWILDEVFSFIDKQGVKQISELIGEHLKAGGSVVATSHQDGFSNPNWILDLDDFDCCRSEN